METCVFDEKRDIKRVVSGLSVDLTDALRTGVIKEGTGDLDYNGVDDPSSIIGRVENVFDAIDAQRAIRKYGKKAESAVEKSIEVPSAPSRPSETSVANG